MMNQRSPISAIQSAEARLEIGTVLAGGEPLSLQVGERLVSARRSAGCLVEPMAGDTALVAMAVTGEAWVTTVLDRYRTSPTPMSFPEGVVMEGEGVRIASSSTIELDAPQVTLTAEEGRANFSRFSLSAAAFAGVVDAGSFMAETFDTVVRYLTGRSVTSHRFVEEMDETQAGNQRTVVDGLSVSQSRQTVITAEEDVKIDGETIHLG